MKARTASIILAAIALAGPTARLLRADDAAPAPAPAAAPATAPAADATAAPAAPMTDQELSEQMAGVERELESEDRKYQFQLKVLQGLKERAVALNDGEAIENANEAISDEKTRHNERLQELGTRWADIKSEQDSRKAAGGGGTGDTAAGAPNNN